MDPVTILPLEILDYIWTILRLPDLMSCMAVSHSWREILSSRSKIWRPLCCKEKLNNISSWYEQFLEESKMKWPWIVGSFNEGFIIEDCEYFCFTYDFIFIIDFSNKLIKYNSFGKKLKEITAPDNCWQLCVVNKDVALLCNRSEFNEIIIYNENLDEILRFTTVSHSAESTGGRLWARSANDPRYITVYYTENGNPSSHIEQLFLPPGSVIQPQNSGWSSMYNGEVSLISENNCEKLYKSDLTPMSTIFLTILSNNTDTLAIIEEKLIYRKYIYWTVFIYRNGIKLHRADVPKLKCWCFSGQYFVGASLNHLSIINLCTGELINCEPKPKEMLNFNDSILNIQNIFDHPKIALIVINYGKHFSVFNADKMCNLVTVNCIHSSMTNDYLNILCVPNMFICASKDNRILVRKAKLQ